MVSYLVEMNDKLVPRCSFSLQRSSGFGKSSTSFAGYLPDYPGYCSREFQSFGFSRLCGGTAQCPAHALEKVLVSLVCRWSGFEPCPSSVQAQALLSQSLEVTQDEVKIKELEASTKCYALIYSHTVLTLHACRDVISPTTAARMADKRPGWSWTQLF